MLKKRSRNSDAVDVPADDPEGTMDRFVDGLKRVLTAQKIEPRTKPRRAKRKRR